MCTYILPVVPRIVFILLFLVFLYLSAPRQSYRQKWVLWVVPKLVHLTVRCADSCILIMLCLLAAMQTLIQ